jgi:hypothetical protein
MGWKRKGRRLVTAVPGVREGGGGVVDPVPRRRSQYYAVARSPPQPPHSPKPHTPTNLPQDRLGSRRAERGLRVPRRTTAHFGGPVSPRRSSQSPGTLRHARILSKPRRATPDRVVSRRPSRATAQDVVGFLRPLPCPADSAGQRRAAWDPSGPSLGRVGSRRASPNHLDPRGATSRHSRGEGHAGLRWSRHTPAGRCLTTRRCDCSGSRRATQEPLGPP